MRKFGKESTAPAEGVNRESGGWLQNHCALAVCVVVILAFVLRTVFAYGISADNAFALSGGSDAQYHLHVVESILNGSFILGSDAAINYPIGGLNANAPLYDFIAAGVGSFAGASTALATLAPIFGALTCFPVYLVGKELYGYKAGFVAALIYGLMALPIVSTVFSNGNEYAFVAFLLSFLIWSLIKVARSVNAGVLAKKETIIAGILFGLVVLSWNDFRAIVVLLAIIMVIQMVLDRFNSKDFGVTLYSYSIIMLIGLVIGAIYYIPANLWDAVFSGPVLIAVITIAFGFIFKALQSKPWIFTIPGLIIAFVAIAAVLFFVAPEYYTALIYGNTSYTNQYMVDLARESISISKMSSYYGWLLMWMPAILGMWELYVYARKERTHEQLFTMATFIVLWIFAWTSYSCAASLGVIFAVASGAVLVKVLQKADLKTYWASMKTAGFPGCFRKMIKPLPFLSVLVVVFLVAAPTVAYAVDAGIPSNADSGYVFYGNTVYTIETGDDYPLSYIYDDLDDDSLAAVTWIDSATGFEAQGISTVNDRDATGASAAAQMYLAKGATGATAAQIVRMIIDSDKDFSACFATFPPALYDNICAYILDPSIAKDRVLADTETFGKLSADISDENAIYLASIADITAMVSSAEVDVLYDNVCTVADKKIGYYLVDGSMVPILYGDSNSLSTIAYFAGYNIDGYGAASEFFSYITYYSNYYPATATDSLYETFLWKALIGPSPSEAGYTSSYSYLMDLALNDGTVKLMPGYGLAGYSIVSWYVKYNADPKATTSDDGWEYMTYYDAISNQQKDGGVINYLSSIIAYEYAPLVGTQVITGTVTNEDGEPLAGISVEVNYFDPLYETDSVFAEAVTDANGRYSVMAPQNYTLAFKNGTVRLETLGGITDVQIASTSFEGAVVLGDSICVEPNYMYVLKGNGMEYYIQTEMGIIRSDAAVDAEGYSVSIIPGKYSYELRDSTATAVGSGTVTFYAGENDGLAVSPKAYTITATVTDFFGNNIDAGTVVATNTTSGASYFGFISDAKSVIYVPSGTYTVSLGNGYVTTNTTSLSVTSNRTVSITGYEANEITLPVTELPFTVYGGSFSTVTDAESVDLPTSIGATYSAYTLYGSDGANAYLGFYTDGAGVTIYSDKAVKLSGTIGTSGTVYFICESGAAMGATVAATAGSDGKFTAIVPAGDYAMYATNGSDKCYIKSSESYTADKSDISVTMQDARKVTTTYNYASSTSKSNVALPFAVVSVVFSFDGNLYTLNSMTDTSGKAVIVIPDAASDISVSVNGGEISTAAFDCDELSAEIDAGTEDVSKTITIAKDKVKTASVKSDYEMKLTPYSGGDDIEFAAGETKTIASGQYTAKIDAETGYFFSGTIYLYPGTSEFSGLNPTEMFKVSITKLVKDDLTITGDKSYEEGPKSNESLTETDVYYFEYGCTYTVKAVNSDTKDIKYGTVYRAAGTEEGTLDMSTSSAPVKITGTVGVIADGKVTVVYDDGGAEVVLEVDVESGAFEVELPGTAKDVVFTAQVTKTVSSQKYGFSGIISVAAPTDGMIVNIPTISENDTVDYTSDIDGYINEARFNDGSMLVTVTVFNNTDLAKTYALTAGSAWSLTEAMQVKVDANSSKSVTLTGYYEPNGSGIGSNGMTVVVSDFNGTGTKTIPIVDGIVINEGGPFTVKTASESNNKDMISGNEYLYALTVVNDGPMATVNFSATSEGICNIRFMNEDGSLIRGDAGSFVAAAQKSTVIYAKVMYEQGEMDKVPGITVSIGEQVLQLSPSTMDISVSSVDVSGDSAVKEKSGVPMGVWFLCGLSIILLILVIWMGSKRGVFSRR